MIDIYEDIWSIIVAYCKVTELWALKDVSSVTRKIVMNRTKERFVRCPMGRPIFIPKECKAYFATIMSSFYYIVVKNGMYDIINATNHEINKVPKKDPSLRLMEISGAENEKDISHYVLCDNMLIVMYKYKEGSVKIYDSIGRRSSAQTLCGYMKIKFSGYTDNFSYILENNTRKCITSHTVRDGKITFWSSNCAYIQDNIIMLSSPLNLWASFITEL